MSFSVAQKSYTYAGIEDFECVPFYDEHRASIESVACTYRSCEPLPIMIEFGKIRTYAHAAHLDTLIASLFSFHHPT